MIKKTMNFLLLLGVLVAFLLILYTFSLFQDAVTNNTYVLSEDVLSSELFESGNIRWLSRNNNYAEIKTGFLGSGVLVNHDAITPKAAVYVYYPQHGKSELIAACGDYYGKFMGCVKIIPFALSEEKILLHYNYVDNEVLRIEQNDIKVNLKDYSYSYVEDTVSKDNKYRKLIEEYAAESASKDRDTKSTIQIYDINSKKSETIFEYRSKYRARPGIGYLPISSFQSIGYSNNSRYIAWCVENELGIFAFSVYDSVSKTKKVYKFTENQGGIHFIDTLTVSNDGNTIWFKVKPIDSYMLNDFKPGSSVYKMTLINDEPVPELIAEDVISYKISYDDRYIIYDTFPKDKSKSSSCLNCLDLLAMNEINIDKYIIECLPKGFDISSSQNKFAYLKKNNGGAELYIGEIEGKNSNSKFICKLPDIVSVDCMDFDYNNKKLLVSYSYSINKKQIHDTCIIDIK